MGVRRADTMTASGTGLLQFSQHGAGLESRSHIHENTILSVRESQLQEGRSPEPRTTFRPMTRSEGTIAVPGGNVWFKRIGAGRGLPLLVIHGGPGLPHDYLLSLERLADER